MTNFVVQLAIVEQTTQNPGYNTGDPEPLVHPQAQGYDYVA